MFSPANTLTQTELKTAIVQNPLVVTAETIVMDAVAQMSGVRVICTENSGADYADNIHQEARSSCVLVMEGKSIVGILTERDIVRLSAQQRSLNHVTVQEVMASPVVTLQADDFTDLFSAVNHLQQHHIRHMPILDQDNCLVGIITHESLRQLARPVDLLRLRLVSEVMTANVVCAAPSTSMLAIAQLMAANCVGSVLIVEHRNDLTENPWKIPLGIITERDIVQFQSLGLSLEQVAVQSVMSAPVFAVQPTDSLMVVQQIMEQRSIRRLVVTGTQGELLGIVTQTSLLQALNPLELYTLSKILEEKVATLEVEKVKLLETYTVELERQVEQRTAELKAQSEREQLVTQIAWWIRQSLQLSEILETIVAKVRQFLEADRVLIYQFQPDMSGTIIAESVLSGWTMALGCQIQDTCFQGNAGGHYHAGNKRAISDIYQADLTPCHLQLLEQFEVKANLVAPILLKDGLWGLLVIHQCSEVRHWQSFELDLLDQLVAQIAIAIQQATAYQQAQTELLKRRHIETTLRQSEQRYATLTEMSPVGIFQTDAAGHCLYVNERWCQIAGLRPDQAAGFGWVEGIHPDDREFVSAAWYAAAQANLPFRLEYRFQNAEGQITWAFGQAVAERDINGTIVGYVGTITDISDRKVAERALQIQRDFNQLIAEITSQFVDLSPDALDAEIERTLQLVGEMIPVDTSYLMQFDQDTSTFSITHEWSQPHYPRQTPFVQKLPISLVPWSIGLIMQREIVQVSCVANLPAVAAIDQATWQQFNVVALLAVPLIQKSTVVGFMGFASFSQTMVWDEEMIRLLQVMAQTIANARQRARDERQIAESEERLRLALAVANQGLYDLNFQTGELVVSPEYATILGYDPATFQETNAQWIERMHPDDRDAVVSLYHDYVAGNLPDYEVEFRQRTQSGDWKWIFSKGKIVAWDEAGNPLRMLGTHTDISDRKRTEEQAQHRLDILEAARDIIASASSSGQITYLNQAARELLGIDPDADILQTSLPDYHPPEIANLILQEALPQCAQQGFWAGETQFLRRDGSNFPAWQVIVAHRHQDGSISHFSTIARDLTNLKQAEAERLQAENLRVELALLENILNIILAGYWDWDIPNNQEYLSPGLKQMFGYADHELPNSPESWQRLIFAEDLPGVLECFDRHVQSHGAVPFYNEVRYRHKNGSTIWVLSSGRVIEWGEAGQPIRMIGCHIDITQRKQVELQLQKSDAHLKTAQRISQLGSWEFDVYTGQVNWSDEVFRIFGRDLGMGAPTFEELQQLIHPDDRILHQQSVQTAIEKKQPYEIEFRIYRQGDILRYLEARGEPIVDATGQLIQLVGTVLDISDRKQAEAALQESERRYATLSEAAPVALFRFDATGRCIYLNDRWSEMTERPIEEGLGLGWTETIHPQDREWISIEVPQWLQTCKAGDLYRNEARILRPDGSIVWYVCQMLPEIDASGTIVGYVGTLTDINDRKQAEEQLLALSDRLNLAIKSAAIAIWDWNVPDNLLTWDDRMYELYGITPDQFTSVYDAWANSLHPEDRLIAETAIQQALLGEKDYDPEFRVIHPDGTIRYIKAYALVQRNDRGEPQHMIGINFDITDRKLAEIQLLQTTAQLEASNRELEAFAYSVSHDLRSPLRAIDGFSKALLEDYGDQFDEDGKDYFDRIRSNVSRMGMLIDDLLRLSRVSRSEMNYTIVNLSTLVQEQLDDLRAADPQRQVTIVIAPGAIVSADATLMRVVLSNLLQNAWKFTSHHDTARIEFGIMPTDTHPIYFVRDDGAGFDMAYAKMLFRVFQRLHNTHEFPGTGIGLATVQRAIHRHGGQVWAEGSVEQGATIYFTVPTTPVRTGANP